MNPVERRVIQVLVLVAVPLLLYPIRGLFTWEHIQSLLAVGLFLVGGAFAVVLVLMLVHRLRVLIRGKEDE